MTMNDRETLIKLLCDKYDHFCDQCGVNKDMRYADNLADYLLANGVTVRPQGEWIYHIDDLFPAEGTQECSNCHQEEKISLCNENYCPNCGAKMQKDGAS